MKLRGQKKHTLILENERLKKENMQLTHSNRQYACDLEKERQGISGVIGKALNLQVQMNPHFSDPRMVTLRCEIQITNESFLHYHSHIDDVAQYLVFELRKAIHRKALEMFELRKPGIEISPEGKYGR